MKREIDTRDPDSLKEPGTMKACLLAKCHAVKQLAMIDAELKRLRAARRAWNRRLGVCLRKMQAIACGCNVIEGRFARN